MAELLDQIPAGSGILLILICILVLIVFFAGKRIGMKATFKIFFSDKIKVRLERCEGKFYAKLKTDEPNGQYRVRYLEQASDRTDSGNITLQNLRDLAYVATGKEE